MTIQELKQKVNRDIVENYTGDITADSVNTIFNETLNHVDGQEQKVIEIERKAPNVEPNDNDVDLTIEDEKGNACLEVAQGEIRTGNFDSSTAVTCDEIENPTHTGTKEPVYAISDFNGNHILEVGKDGHIRTRAFDSSNSGGGTSGGHPLSGKTLILLGDSQVGQCANLDINILNKLPLKDAYRCGFSGCNMAYRNDAYNAFCMHNIALCMATKDFSSMETALANVGSSYRSGYQKSLNLLKSINLGDGDGFIITIQFGGNDYRMNTSIGEDNTEDTHTMKGATAYVIRTLLEAFPKVTIIFVGQPYRVLTHEGTTILTDSDGKANSIGKYRVDYQDACGEVASANHTPFFDMYRRSGRNKYNAFQIGSDGTHPTTAYGQKITSELYCRILTSF